MSRFWNKKTHDLTPYVAGEQPVPGQKVIKLNTNENPYPPSPEVMEHVREFNTDCLRRYPDLSSRLLREALADFFGVRPTQVFCGNGSDEVLAFSFQAFFESDEESMPLLYPEISYSFYPVYANLYSIPTRTVPLRSDMTIPVEPFLEPSGGVAIANPNAPTSIALPVEDIRRILESDPDRLVLVDQAYAAFGNVDCLPLLESHPNLLIIGTLSKSHSLAGLRVGYAIASEEIIEGLCRVRDSFNSYPVDTLAHELATLAVRDRKYFESTRDMILATRESSARKFRDLGFTVAPSQTNFLFVKPSGISAEELYKKLRDTGILVRYFRQNRVSDYLRITVGTDEEMKELFSQVERILREKK